MKTVVKGLYEAMFLVDSAVPESAAADSPGDSSRRIGADSISTAVRKILEKAGAEIVSMKKWDERRLAYEINGKNRGTYILCYFHADGQKIRQIERDAQLSELILRVLILSAAGGEGRDKEDIEKDTASQSARVGGSAPEGPGPEDGGKKTATSDV